MHLNISEYKYDGGDADDDDDVNVDVDDVATSSGFSLGGCNML